MRRGDITNTKEFNIFRDVWKLYMSNKEIDKDWDKILNEAHAIDRIYGNDKLCQELLVCVITDLERKEKAIV